MTGPACIVTRGGILAVAAELADFRTTGLTPEELGWTLGHAAATVCAMVGLLVWCSFLGLALATSAQGATPENVAARRTDAKPLRRLRVSENHRFLVTEDGRPFFYLADTAWELFHRLSREEADRYLADRAAKGFTVIQAVALAELDGLTVPNRDGFLPLVDGDPGHPDVRPGPRNEIYERSGSCRHGTVAVGRRRKEPRHGTVYRL
jgi:hypothetical protein